MNSIGRIRGALIVWVVSYVFFLLTLVNNFSASHDSIHYLLDIVNGHELFHQHHLLYNFLANKWLGLWNTILPGVPQYYIIESFTALWGSSALTVIYLFFRNRFFLQNGIAVAGTLIIAFSYGFWFYSVNIEVYLPPLFFILMALYTLSSKKISAKDIWKIAIWHSLAILFHQVNILFTIVVLYVILVNRKNINVSKALLQYCLIGIVIVGGMYFVAGWYIEGHHSLPEWIRWMEGYTVGHSYWQPPGWQTPLHVTTGFVHAFIGGHFIFRLPVVENYMLHSFAAHGLNDEIFLSANISSAMAWLLTLFTLFLFLVLLLLVIRFIKKYAVFRSSLANTVRPLLLSILVYSLFFCFWMPEILEFWIPQMVFTWLLLIGVLPSVRFPFNIPLRAGLFSLALIIFVINFFGSIRWLQDIRHDWYYNETLKIKGIVSSGDLVIVENEWILKDFVRYFTPAMVIATDEPGYNEADAQKVIEEIIAKKGKVYIYKNRVFIQSY